MAAKKNRRKPFSTPILGFNPDAKRWGAGDNHETGRRVLTEFEKVRCSGKGLSKFWPRCLKCSRETNASVPVEGYSLVEAKGNYVVIEYRCHGQKCHRRLENHSLGANWWERENFLLLACRHISRVFESEDGA